MSLRPDSMAKCIFFPVPSRPLVVFRLRPSAAYLLVASNSEQHTNQKPCAPSRMSATAHSRTSESAEATRPRCCRQAPAAARSCGRGRAWTLPVCGGERRVVAKEARPHRTRASRGDWAPGTVRPRRHIGAPARRVRQLRLLSVPA